MQHTSFVHFFAIVLHGYTKNVIAYVPVHSYIFNSFSPCWPLAFLIFSPALWNFHVSLPTKFFSFVFSHSLKLLSKITLDFGVFFSKSPSGHPISCQKYLELPVVSYMYLLIALF